MHQGQDGVPTWITWKCKVFWSQGHIKLPMNVFKLTAIRLTCMGFLTTLWNTIQILMDNILAMHYINKQEGVWSFSLCLEVINLWELCQQRGVTLRVLHLPGVSYDLSDFQSRSVVMSRKYSLQGLLLQGRWEHWLPAKCLSTLVVLKTIVCLPTNPPDSQDNIKDQMVQRHSHQHLTGQGSFACWIAYRCPASHPYAFPPVQTCSHRAKVVAPGPTVIPSDGLDVGWLCRIDIELSPDWYRRFFAGSETLYQWD